MALSSGVDVTARVGPLQEKGDKENKRNKEENNGTVLPVEQSEMMIRRIIRPGMVCVFEKTKENGGESVRYYTGKWCAFDDPRKGLNVRQTAIDGLFFPAAIYHFPELLWAEPKTRQADPKIKEGTPPIHLYQNGSETLEVDAASGHPLKYSDGTQEWTYSYKENSTPIVLPERLDNALKKILSKQKK